MTVTWGSPKSSLPDETIVTSWPKAGKPSNWVRVPVGEGQGWVQGPRARA